MKTEESMKTKPEKRRLEEIEEVYKTLGLQDDEMRKYFLLLSNMPTFEKQEGKPIIFIEADTVSFGTGDFANAGLESNS